MLLFTRDGGVKAAPSEGGGSNKDFGRRTNPRADKSGAGVSVSLAGEFDAGALKGGPVMPEF